MAKRTSPSHSSWLPEANKPDVDFPLTHLPFGAVELEGQQHLCVAIGTHLLDLYACAEAGVLPSSLIEACKAPTLNLLMSQGHRSWTLLRETLMTLLSSEAKASDRQSAEAALHSIAGATLVKPVHIPNYTDFYASIDHAFRVGQLFRPDQPLLPNYKHLPIGYHGRASSIIPSEMPVIRPTGQSRPAPTGTEPEFGPTKSLDYELELGLYIGQPNFLGTPIPIVDADRHLFGVSLLNDWSARDIQAWEYQPLGPFLGKSFATSVSPWVVTMEALAPYRVQLAARAEGDPQPLPYLASRKNREQGIDVQLEVYLSTQKMRDASLKPVRLSCVSAKELYWSFAQMVAHHTSNGCNLRTGDLLASGTISGPRPGSQGSLLEITRRGAEPLKLASGEERSFLEDGDEVTLKGFCERQGLPRISLGECKGMIIPATLSSRAAI
jgi:fumarylacetoacetase